MTRALLFVIGLIALSIGGSPAQAQNVNLNCWNPNATSGLNQWLPCNSTTPLVVSASVSASITGFPTTQSTGTPISVTTGGVTGTLPTGVVVVASNVGATNGAYCKLGASATTSDQLIPPNSWFAFTVGAATQLTCITSTSTTTVNMVGGSGLPTGSGGGVGSGGGGGGAVTVADGADVALGTTTDAACATDNGTCTLEALTKRNNQRLTTVNTTLGSPFQAGGSIGNTTFAATQATGTNLHVVLDTTSTTAVTQATASNLNATVVGTGTFVTQSTLAAETTKVIGTTRITGNVGGVLDAIGQNVTAPANWLQAGCQFNTSPTTISSGSGSPCQVDSAGNLLVNVKTATGLAQGSTTSGQTGSMIMGAVTTAAPSYTTAQTAYLSLTTAGAMRQDITSVNSVAILTGTGSTGTGAQRVTVATDQATNAGAALVKGGVGVVNGGSTYQAVAASQTATVLQTSTGATGDYLSHCDIYPTSTSPGVVTVFDNTNAAAGSAILFPGGASSLSNLAPIPVPVGAVSTAGAWKVTTGANVSVVCYGKFS